MANPTARKILEAFPKVKEADAKKLAGMMRETAGGGQGVEDTLQAANELIDGSGVESLASEVGDTPRGYWMDSQAAYVNLGDTYDVTILHDNMAGEYLITSWGDWLEGWEEENAEEEVEEEEEA